MTGWQLVTLLAALLNTWCLVKWQRANETRLDIHYALLKSQQAQIKDLLPMLNQVSAQLCEWERWKNAEAEKGTP